MAQNPKGLLEAALSANDMLNGLNMRLGSYGAGELSELEKIHWINLAILGMSRRLVRVFGRTSMTKGVTGSGGSVTLPTEAMSIVHVLLDGVQCKPFPLTQIGGLHAQDSTIDPDAQEPYFYQVGDTIYTMPATGNITVKYASAARPVARIVHGVCDDNCDSTSVLSTTAALGGGVAIASMTADIWNYCLVEMLSGDCKDERALVTDSAYDTDHVDLTIRSDDEFTANPASGDRFVLSDMTDLPAEFHPLVVTDATIQALRAAPPPTNPARGLQDANKMEQQLNQRFGQLVMGKAGQFSAYESFGGDVGGISGA